MFDTDKPQSDAAFSAILQGSGRKRVIKVTDHVYVAVGYALANMIMIEGNACINALFTYKDEI